MIDFFNEIGGELSTLLQTGEAGVLVTALLAGLLCSIAAGVVGTYVVTRRITYLAGGIAHCVLGGIGAAVYCRDVLGWTGADPLLGAVAAALAAAVIIGLVSLRLREREDTVISALWVLGMGGGILLISLTPGYKQHLMSYLFGDILMAGPGDLFSTAVLDLAIIFIAVVFYRPLLAVCFDEEFARSRGIRTEWYYLLLLGMTAVTVVFLVTLVGIVMVIAMLALPAAIAAKCARTLWTVMVLATVFCAVFSFAGLAASYGPGLPSGATIVVIAATCYLLFLGFSGIVTLLRHSGNRTNE